MNKGCSSECQVDFCLGRPKKTAEFSEDSPFAGKYCTAKVDGITCMKVIEWERKEPEEILLSEEGKPILPKQKNKSSKGDTKEEKTLNREIKKKKKKKENPQIGLNLD